MFNLLCTRHPATQMVRICIKYTICVYVPFYDELAKLSSAAPKRNVFRKCPNNLGREVSPLGTNNIAISENVIQLGTRGFLELKGGNNPCRDTDSSVLARRHSGEELALG